MSDRPGGRGGRHFLLGIVAALAFSGCGLEKVSYLAPPSFASFSGLLSLTDSLGASDVHYYEMFYRIYQNQSEAATALAGIYNLASSTASPETIYNQLKGTLKLQPALFQYLDTGANPDNTVLSWDATKSGTTVSFQITTPINANWVVNKIGTTTTEIADAINRNYGNNLISKPLFDVTQLASGDTDYTPDATTPLYAPSVATAYMVLCVVAEAFPNFPTPVYSAPAVFPYILQLPSAQTSSQSQ